MFIDFLCSGGAIIELVIEAFSVSVKKNISIYNYEFKAFKRLKLFHACNIFSF